MRLALGFVALLLLASPGVAPAAVSVQGKYVCAYTHGSACFYFYVPGIPFTGQTVDFKAPGPGKVLVSTTGSGYCVNGNTEVGGAVFDTQIVDDPSATPSYSGPGGNKFDFTLPAYNGAQQFNLASQRVFGIKKAGTHHYALNFVGDRFDAYVQCDVYSVAMSVLFIPG